MRIRFKLVIRQEHAEAYTDTRLQLGSLGRIKAG